MYLYGIQIASSNLAPEHGCLTPCDPVRRAVLTQKGDEVAEAKTIFEEQDLSGHKKDCDCADCIHTETDDPHHPECHCGECHCFTDEEEPDEPIEEDALLALHGAAGTSREHQTAVTPTLSGTKGKDLLPPRAAENPDSHPLETKGWGGTNPAQVSC